MKSVYKRELSGFFRTMSGGAFLLAVTLTMGACAAWFCVMNGYRSVQQCAQYACLLYIPAIPLLLMDQFAKEKRLGIDGLFCSAPVRLGGVAVGKYLSALTLLLIACLISCVFPAALVLAGGAPVFANAVAMIGLFALGAFLMGCQTLMSALTPNRVAALLCGVALMLLFRFMADISAALADGGTRARIALIALMACAAFLAYLASRNAVVSLLIACATEIPVLVELATGGSAIRSAYAYALNALSPFARLSGFLSGMLDVEALVYYGTGAVLTVVLSAFAVTRPGGGLRRAVK